MRQLIVTEWMSLDGIFDSNLMNQWFEPYHSDSRAASIRDTIDNCEVMLYGRHTYEMMYPYWSSLKNNEMGVAAKLNAVKKYVVTTTLKAGAWQSSTVIRQNAMKEVAALKAQEGGPILVQGSATLVRSLLEANLVDELKLMIQPHIMGFGRRLWEENLNVGLERLEVQNLDKGVTVVRFKPIP
jgi:dihydrofolate reductase